MLGAQRSTVVGCAVAIAIVAIAVVEPVAAIAFFAAFLGAGAAVFWEIRWFNRSGRYEVGLGDVAGFIGRYSFVSGEAVPLFIHTTAAAECRLYRYGSMREEAGVTFRVERSLQSPTFDRRTGFDWRKTAEMPTGELTPGLYGIEIRQIRDQEKSFIIPFVIKTANAQPVAVLLATNTWDAYNDYGGMSKYKIGYFGFFSRKIFGWGRVLFGRGAFFDVRLPTRRPNRILADDLRDQSDPRSDFHSRFVRCEWCLIAFLERAGYDFSLLTEEDLALNVRNLDCDALVIPGHSEYWSEDMFYAYDRYVARGGKVIVSTGIPMFRAVVIENGSKTYAHADFDSEVAAQRTGGHFTPAGACTAAPYRIERAESWVFAGTGLSNGDLFGQSSAYQALPDFTTRSEPVPSGASGVWMSTVGRGSSEFDILAQGINEAGGACMMFRETPAGGWIFSSGSDAFFGALDRDIRVAQIIHNLLDAASAGGGARQSRDRLVVQGSPDEGETASDSASCVHPTVGGVTKSADGRR